MVLPNQLTVLRIILTPFFFVFFLINIPIYQQIALGVFIVAALTDWYDGWLARKYNYITAWGKFWDPLADKILTSAAFLAFVLKGELVLWMVLIILIRDFAITGLRIFADYKQYSFYTSNYAKWKTFFQMSFLYYLLIVYAGKTIPYFYKNYSFIIENYLLNRNFVYYAMLFISVITFHSGLVYLYKNKSLLKQLVKHEN